MQAQEASADRHFATTMAVRSLLLFVLGFSALFGMQGCGSENRYAQICDARAACCCLAECGPVHWLIGGFKKESSAKLQNEIHWKEEQKPFVSSEFTFDFSVLKECIWLHVFQASTHASAKRAGSRFGAS